MNARAATHAAASTSTSFCSCVPAARLSTHTRSHRQLFASPLPRRSIAGNATEHSTDSADDAGPPEFAEDLTRDFRGSEEEWVERRKWEVQQGRQSWRESLSFQPESLNGGGATVPGTFGDKIKAGFDKVLIADFFFVCLSLVALVVAIGVQTVSKSTALTSLWLAAWPVLFQPAIGVLMAGALFSGLLGWVQSDVMKD